MMRIEIFGYDESIILFNMLGLEGKIISDEEKHFKEKFEDVLNDPEIGIVIITERLFEKYKDYLLPIKLYRKIPIIVEIPELIYKFNENYIPDLIKNYINLL